jgi:predicted transcriptional regulator
MRHLRADEVEELKKLREEGWMIKNLAKHFGICTATVSNIMAGKTDPAKKKPAKQRVPKSSGIREFEEVNFKTLPNDALFQHVRIWDFIG